jgi:hypothetical protein
MRGLNGARGRALLGSLVRFGGERGRPLAILLRAAVVLLVSISVVGAYRSAAASAPPLTPGRSTSLALAALLVAAVVLDAKGLSQAGGRFREASISRSRFFPLGFGAIVVLAIVCRIVWTKSVYVPANTPDGWRYLLPALENPKFPLNEVRPIAFPYLISFSLAVFRHPVGILIVHNVLAIAAAAVLALGVRRCLRSDAVSLILLAYMLFSAKNVAFEYLLLTEHLYRCVVALVLGILLWLCKPASLAVAAGLAVLTLVGVFTKPTAVVLVPAVLTGFLVRRWVSPRWAWRDLWKPSLVYAAVVAAFVGAYMTAFHRRFGSFQITSMTGFALYWNVNPLTDLEGPAHPEVKRELRKFFPLYLEKYAEHGQNLGDWVIWGSKSPEIERDFGEQSPERVVYAYVQTRGSGSVFHRMDRVFMDLSIEAIRAHPMKYLRMSVRSTLDLVRSGLTFSYPVMPLEDASEISSRVWFFRNWSVVAHVPADDLVVPAGFRPVSRRSIAVLAPEIVSRSVETWFRGFLLASLILFGATAWAAALDRSGREDLLALAPLAVGIGSYVLLCGFIVPGEPPRYLQPVQDIFVAGVLAVFLIGWRSIQALAAAAPARMALNVRDRRI